MKRQAAFVLILTIAYGLTFVMSEFFDSPISGLRDFTVQLLQWGVVEATVFLFLWMLASNKYLFAIAFPIVTLVCSVAAFFRFTMKVTITQMTVELALVNDMRTSIDMITPPMILFALLSLALSIVATVYRFRRISLRHNIFHFFIPLILLGSEFQIGALSLPVCNRIPFSIYASLKETLSNHKIKAEKRPLFGGNTYCKTDSMDVVFILGETLRAKNMQTNGYYRATTPLLMKEKNAVSLPNIYSHYYFTHKSVPYILTRSCPEHCNRSNTERSFISIFRRAGYSTTWIANQESVPTFIYFMNEADSLIYINGGKSLYIYEKWTDGDLLPVLRKTLYEPSRNKKSLTILHTIGSHWWYRSHYPDSMAKWKPELRSRTISENTKDEFRNSYDNTILYSDYFWQQVRNMLRNRNAIVIYLSDHGENIGEDNFYGHANDTPYLHNPGCWIWYSDKFAQRYPHKVAALRRNRLKPYDTAFLFHSILDAGDINTKYLEKKYDIFI